jgi:DNA replication and repair protein RecF
VRPVALADDVLGELDPGRRRRFWSALDSCQQVLATGTTVPDVPAPGGWQVFSVERGAFIPSAT